MLNVLLKSVVPSIGQTKPMGVKCPRRRLRLLDRRQMRL